MGSFEMEKVSGCFGDSGGFASDLKISINFIDSESTTFQVLLSSETESQMS